MSTSNQPGVSAQSLEPIVPAEAGRAQPGVLAGERRRVLYRTPDSTFHAFLILTRADSAVALLMPVLCGAATAWWEGGLLSGFLLFVSLLGVLSAAMGFSALCEYRDHKRCRAEAETVAEPYVTGASMMTDGLMQPTVGRNLGLILLAVGLVCSLWLVMVAGWPVLFFVGSSFLLLLAYALPPLALGSRGWGLGEISLFLGFGLLPLLCSYYVQGRALTLSPLWLSIPLGLLSALIFLNYDLLHQRRDRLMRKRTLVAGMEPLRALDLSALLSVAAYASIVLIVALARLPFSLLIGLLALPVALGVFARIDSERLTGGDLMEVYRASASALALTGALLCLALWIDKVL
jgi:1,4-dihydroxy-2-naphthoate octaprenyltransferase